MTIIGHVKMESVPFHEKTPDNYTEYYVNLLSGILLIRYDTSSQNGRNGFTRRQIQWKKNIWPKGVVKLRHSAKESLKCMTY
jgi:hypothetical protein